MNKEEKIKIKKTQIIEALKNLLEQGVYSQISVEDVAEEAGLSKGGLRHYFPTKEELYNALLEDFFVDIEKEHLNILQDIDIEDVAFMSTLFSIEKFMLNKRNIKIFINVLLYGFEDPKIMEIVKKFIRNHLNLFKEIIEKQNNSSAENILEEDKNFQGRIIQIILLFSGLFETIDPINMDTRKLIKHIITLSKKV